MHTIGSALPTAVERALSISVALPPEIALDCGGRFPRKAPIRGVDGTTDSSKIGGGRDRFETRYACALKHLQPIGGVRDRPA